MKKLITFLAIFFALGTTSNELFAQWTSKYFKGDPLKETEDCWVDSYTSKDGCYAFMSQSNSEALRFYTTKGIFNYDLNQYCHFVIGFYVGNTLLEKKDVWFYVPTDEPTMAISNKYKQKRISRKIKEHLRTKGNIRVIADLYGDDDLDFMIPYNKNLK